MTKRKFFTKKMPLKETKAEAMAYAKIYTLSKPFGIMLYYLGGSRVYFYAREHEGLYTVDDVNATVRLWHPLVILYLIMALPIFILATGIPETWRSLIYLFENNRAIKEDKQVYFI